MERNERIEYIKKCLRESFVDIDVYESVQPITPPTVDITYTKSPSPLFKLENVIRVPISYRTYGYGRWYSKMFSSKLRLAVYKLHGGTDRRRIRRYKRRIRRYEMRWKSQKTK